MAAAGPRRSTSTRRRSCSPRPVRGRVAQPAR
jgi:hypothetical protein